MVRGRAAVVVVLRVDNHLAVLAVHLALEAGGAEARLAAVRSHVFPEIKGKGCSE